MSVASDALVQAVAGLGGSIFSTLIVHPIDFVKMRMQVPGAKYDGLIDAFRQIAADEGFLQLYTGLGSELIKSSTQNFIYIYVYSLLKDIAIDLQTKRYERRWERQQRKELERTASDGSLVLTRMQSDISKAKALEPQAAESSSQEGSSYSSNTLVTPRAHRATLGLPNALPSSSSSSSTPDLQAPSPRSAAAAASEAEMIAAPSPTNPPLPGGAERPAFSSMQLDVLTNILIGIAAGCVTQLFVNPLSVVQTRIMTQKKATTDAQFSIFGMGRKIVAEEGVGVLFTGLIPSLILTTNPAIQFLVFDRLKSLVLSFRSSSSAQSAALTLHRNKSSSAAAVASSVLPGRFSLLIGGIAKLTATLVTYPYIMAKLRLQWKGEGAQAEIKYRGALHVIATIVRQDGFLALYTGFGAQLFKSVLATSLLFFGKEKAMYYLALLITYLQERESGNADSPAKEKKE